jgi:RsiW-degrading membrane proteinase PrsW (M82 family)
VSDRWKNFVPLPPSRRRKEDGPLTRVFVVVSITVISALAFALWALYYWLDWGWIGHPAAWLLVGAVIGGLFGFATIIEYYLRSRKGRKGASPDSGGEG